MREKSFSEILSSYIDKGPVPSENTIKNKVEPPKNQTATSKPLNPQWDLLIDSISQLKSFRVNLWDGRLSKSYDLGSRMPRTWTQAQLKALELFGQLGCPLKKDVNNVEIRRAYRTLAKQIHPDRQIRNQQIHQNNPTPLDLVDSFSRLRLAYHTLTGR